MNPVRRILTKLRSLVQRRRFERDMAAEMLAHIEMQEAAHRAAGLSPQEAHYVALRQFGHLDGVKEAARDQRSWVWMESLLEDFRFAVRTLVKSPGFTLAVVATLAIGIGVTTAIMSYAGPIVFPKRVYRHPERMVVVTSPDSTGKQAEAPYPFFPLPYRFAFIRETATAFEALGASRFDQMNLVVRGDPGAANVGWVTMDYLSLFGGIATQGRLFLPEDYRNNATDVAILSWVTWHRRFGGDPGIIGQEVILGGKSRRVIGVLAMPFAPPIQFSSADVYLPEAPSSTPTAFPFQWLQVVGRLKPGITLEQVRAELALLHPPAPSGLDAAFIEHFKPVVIPLAHYSADPTIYWVFIGAVAFFYAIACSNAVSLMLARTIARRRELGVRLAIGGSRWQIVRLLLAESLVLSALAGLAGLLVARWGYWALIWHQQDPGSAPTIEIPVLSPTVLATVVAVSVLTSVVVVIIPALRIRRTRLCDALKEGTGSLGDSLGLQRLRDSLVIAQAALAVALLAGAGLALRSFWRLEKVSLGFDPANKLAVSGMLPEGGSDTAYLNLTRQLQDEIARLPGVANVTCSGVLPLAHFAFSMPAKIDGRPDMGQITFSANRVSPEYFATMGLPMVAGRGFAGLHPKDPPVAIINETAARSCFGSTDPVGKHLDLDKYGKWEVVGVVGDVREWGRRTEIKPQLYFPFWQPPVTTGSFVVLVQLSSVPPMGLEAMIRRAAYAAEPRLVVTLDRLSDNARNDTQKERNAMLILQVLSTLALVLAAVGLFAVMAYVVAQRKREFGVRMALGASPMDLLRMVLRRGLLLAATGVVIGLGAAWALTRFLQSVLYETSPHDPLTYFVVAVMLFGVAALACWLPARRAAAVDPMIALRAE